MVVKLKNMVKKMYADLKCNTMAYHWFSARQIISIANTLEM